jgi:hypothetical protein
LPSAVTSALVSCWLKIAGSSAGSATKPASSTVPTPLGNRERWASNATTPSSGATRVKMSSLAL